MIEKSSEELSAAAEVIIATPEIPALKKPTLFQMIEMGLDVVGVCERKHGCFTEQTIYLKGLQQVSIEGAELVQGYQGLETKVIDRFIEPKHVFSVDSIGANKPARQETAFSR